MNCALRKCPHSKQSACISFGQCGAEYALERASEPGGYRVHLGGNPVIKALKDAGLVTTSGDKHGEGIVRAVRSAA